MIAAAIVAAKNDGRLLVDPGISPEDAYLIQAEVVAARVARGEVRRGYKLGYTSDVMRQQMGIAEPNIGPLTDAMLLSDGAVVTGGVTHPRIEPEVAVVVNDDGSYRFHAALEIVDSVWRDYAFTWASNTADGSSAAFVVLGPQLADPISDVRLEINGVDVATGNSSAAMGDPRHAMHWLIDTLAERGEALASGDVVITGGLTPAQPLAVGDVATAYFKDTSVSVKRGEANA